MKKFLLLLAFIFALSTTTFAGRISLDVRTYKQSTNTVGSGKTRVPASFPVYAFYDDETNQIEVEGPDHMAGDVYLYDESGMQLGYSSSLNAVFDLPENFHGLVLIEWIGDDWDGRSGIEI